MSLQFRPVVITAILCATIILISLIIAIPSLNGIKDGNNVKEACIKAGKSWAINEEISKNEDTSVYECVR